MSKTKYTIAKLEGPDYIDPQLPAISIFEDKNCDDTTYFAVDISQLHILARLEFFGQKNNCSSARDSYALNLFIPVAKNLEEGERREGRGILVDFRQLQDRLQIHTSGEFQANNPTIQLQVQAPRQIPLLVRPGQSSDDRGILDPACLDEQPYRENPGIDFIPSESALFNLHAQLMETRAQLVSWNSFAREGSCSIEISSEVPQEHSFRVDTVRSPNSRLNSQLRMAYSRDPIIETKPIGF